MLDRQEGRGMEGGRARGGDGRGQWDGVGR